MAQIIADSKQMQALGEIESLLATIKQFNALISGQAAGAELSLNIGPEKGSKGGIRIVLPEDHSSAVIGICEKYRAALKKSAIQKAGKFRIALSDEDLSVLGADADAKN